MSFEIPTNDKPVGPDGFFYRTWLQWIIWIQQTVSANRLSGPTSKRPTEVVWIGQRYYDTTINKPVYVSAVKPIVWRDSAGVIA